MIKKLYFLEKYVRCGAMPLYLIFYRDRMGQRGHYVMLCSIKKMRLLLREKRGFSVPEKYGQILFKSYESEPDQIVKGILKNRYYFDLDSLSTGINRF